MYRDFRKALQNFIEDRVEEIGSKFVIKNKKFQELNRESINLYNQIRDSLPDHLKDLIDDYESITVSLEGIAEDILYERGFIDGIRLNRIIKSIKCRKNWFGRMFYGL